MLGRVVALLVLTAFTLPFAPPAAVEEAEAQALDTLLRTYEYRGMNRQDVLLLLAPNEVHSRYYFVMESESLLGPTEHTTEEDTAIAVAYVEVRPQSTSTIMCRGPVHDVSGGNKHLNCDGLKPSTHYVVTYFNTLPAEITLWGYNPNVPAPSSGFNPLSLIP